MHEDCWVPDYTDTTIINEDGSSFDPMIDIWSRGSEYPPTRTEYDELNPRSAWRAPTLAEVKFGRVHNLFDLDIGWGWRKVPTLHNVSMRYYKRVGKA